MLLRVPGARELLRAVEGALGILVPEQEEVSAGARGDISEELRAR
jgi:hypothetical protein